MGSNRTIGRRGFLAAAAGGAVLSSPVASSVSRAQPDEYSGKLVFCYDDSPWQDYTKTFPIHQEQEAPGCVAAVSGRLGTSGSLTVDELAEMESAGWEVISHTIEHRAVGTLEVTEDVEPGDTKIYDVSNVHGNHPGDRVRIFDDEKHVFATVAGQGTDERGDYIVLEEEIDESFTALESYVRYTDERIRKSLEGSKEQLEDYGFEVSNLVLPYGINGLRAREMIPEYYDGVHNANWRGNGINSVDPLNPYAMHRQYFRHGEMTEDELEAWMDELVESEALGLLGGHSQYNDLGPQRIRVAIQRAKERDIEIVTLREALDDIETIEPDPMETVVPPDTPTPTPGPTLGEWTPPDTTADGPPETSGQPGFGIGAAVAGAGLYAWNRVRRRE